MALRSLRQKFMLGQVIATLFSLLMMGGFSYYLMVNALKHAQHEKLEVLSEQFALHLTQEVERYKSLLSRVETLDFHRTSRDLPLVSHFSKFHRVMPLLSYLDETGREEVKVVDGARSERLIEYGGAPWFQAAMARPNEVIVYGPTVVEEYSEPVLLLAQARFEYFGDQFAGVVQGGVPLGLLTRALAGQNIGKRGFVLLHDRAGGLLFHSRHIGAATDLSALEGRVPVPTGVLGSPKVRQGELSGVDCFWATAREPCTGWSILVALPYDEFMEVPNRLLASGLVIGVLAVSLGLVLIAGISRPISRHLKIMARHTRRVAAGDLSGRLKVETGDELQLLAESVNDMTESISRSNESRNKLDNLLQSIIDPLIVTDSEDRVIKVNQALLALVQKDEAEVVGLPLSDIFPDASPFCTPGRMRASLRAGRLSDVETEIFHSSGTVVPILLSCSLCEPEVPSASGMIATIKDITERKQAEEKISRLAYYDPLTGLPNRSLLQNRLDLALRQGKRDLVNHGELLGVLFLDLDRFKVVNDTLGHDVGDRLLVEVASRLMAILRGSDTVSRYGQQETLARLGGDEFVILLPRIKGPDDAATVAAKVIDAMGQPFNLEGYEVFAPTSIGISLFPHDGSDLNTLLKNADSAMYHAKSAGRNTFHFYSEAMNQQSKDRLRLESRLRSAVSRQEGFSLNYQLRVDAATGQVDGAEALLRWTDAELGFVSPAEFIPLAEETGQILSLGEWVLREACRQAKQWQEAGLPPVKVAVNLSGRQLMQPDFSDRVACILDDTGLAPECLELELTESMLMDAVDENIRTMRRLKAFGLTLAIDDFGTGYSSLRYLQRFPIDVLKIDKSFVDEIETAHDDSAIIRATIALAHSLNLRVVAEGVETEIQAHYLKRHGCDEFQGYLFGKPIPAGEFALLIQDQPREVVG